MVGLALSIALGAALVGFEGSAHSLSKAELVCRGIPDDQRDGSGLTNPDFIRAVHKIETETSATDGRSWRGGARMIVTAAPGRTAEGLQRIADCHAARLVAFGNLSRTTRSPLDVESAVVLIKPKGNAFTVDIISTDPRAAHEILIRARALLPAHAGKR
jgi:hypothetical protein